MKKPVVYLLACACPPARHVGELVDIAQGAGWEACVVATPSGRHFIDATTLAEQTGHPIRSEFKRPGDPDTLPDPDALMVAPATVNTVCKLSAGIADTLVAGLLVEGLGKGLPIVVAPFTNIAMARHPAFVEGIERLRRWGVTVLHGDDVLELHPPGIGEARAANFPWRLAWAALEQLWSSPARAGTRW